VLDAVTAAAGATNEAGQTRIGLANALELEVVWANTTTSRSWPDNLGWNQASKLCHWRDPLEGAKAKNPSLRSNQERSRSGKKLKTESPGKKPTTIPEFTRQFLINIPCNFAFP